MIAQFTYEGRPGRQEQTKNHAAGKTLEDQLDVGFTGTLFWRSVQFGDAPGRVYIMPSEQIRARAGALNAFRS
jgi:hypothetical protein